MPRILEISTNQTAPFKTVIETLKETLVDVNIVCCSVFKKDEDGKNINMGYMKIFATDPSKTVLIDLKLDASSFTNFYCPKKKILGVNLPYFNKIIKIIDKDEWLTLFIDDEEENILKIKIHNHNEQKDTIFSLKLLNLDDETVSIPETIIDSHIIIGANEFHKTCREMLGIADYVEFQCLPDAFIMKCIGDQLDRTTRYKPNKSEEGSGSNGGNANTSNVDIDFGQSDNANLKIVQGIYELKHLVSFTKFSTLCQAIEIYMRNDYPLVIKYSIATLGRLFLCLSPMNLETDELNDYSETERHYLENI
jgi:proliferating cell nuclear antigen PCNA